jgi:hypothetical protein
MQAHPEQKYTVTQLNNYPTGVQAVGIVSTLLWALGTDIWGRRWLSGYFVAATAIGNAIILLVPSSSITAKFGAYYWAGSIYCIQATFFAWANDSMRDEPATLRAVVIACMNFAGNLFQVWWPLIFFRTDAAPAFTVSISTSEQNERWSPRLLEHYTDNFAEGFVCYDWSGSWNRDLDDDYAVDGEATSETSPTNHRWS